MHNYEMQVLHSNKILHVIELACACTITGQNTSPAFRKLKMIVKYRS